MVCQQSPMPLHSGANSRYREILQKYVNRFVWFIFNVTFISFIQSVLLFAFSCVPAYAILLSTKFDESITNADMAYFAVEVALVVSEWFSDGQMWSRFTLLLALLAMKTNGADSLPNRQVQV